MQNRKGMVSGLIRAWFKFGLGFGRLQRKGMKRLLGRLKWALRLQTGRQLSWWKVSEGDRVP